MKGISGADRLSSAPSAVDRCASALRDAIVGGELPAGLRLPPERELATRFGVNRVTVRSALAHLEAEHLVAVRQGSGYAVRDFRRAGGPDLIATLASIARTSRDRATIVRDLLMVRRHLARATLEQLVDVADEVGLARVEASIDRFEASIDAGASVAELADRDLEVVESLAEATGSTVLQLCFNPVAALLRKLPELQEAIYADPASNVAAFRALVALVRSRRRESIEMMVAQLAERDEATVAAVLRGNESGGKRR